MWKYLIPHNLDLTTIVRAFKCNTASLCFHGEADVSVLLGYDDS